MIDTMELTERIECGCTICTANAKRLGKSTPLAAMTTAQAAAAVNGNVHGLVHLAHDPIVGPHQRTARAL